jgi:enoyl-CoA hydratase/carnithine racemase
MTDSVKTRREGRTGRIVLDRPAALNALDLPMIRAIAHAMEEFAAEPAVHAVVIEGAGERAFCAGGDVRAVRRQAIDGEAAGIESFFAEEYAVNGAIGAYPKPWIALIDGVCMGGGIGLSVHGSARVVTEHALLAMPETAIALFPDVGATYALPRLPGALGMYLALTGARLRGADAVHAGLATHYVPRAHLPALSAALSADGAAALATHAHPLPPFDLADHRAAIDRCFGAEDVAGILAALEAEGTDWARETLATIRRMSPSSVLWSFAILRAGASRTLPEALEAELRLTRTATRHPDFREGVRAMVVDKDRSPKWSPARIEDVDPAAIAAMLG